MIGYNAKGEVFEMSDSTKPNGKQKNDWNERFSKASEIVSHFNSSNNLPQPNQPNRLPQQAVEIEFGDDSAPKYQKSAPIKKLYEPQTQSQPQNQNQTPAQSTETTEIAEITERTNRNYAYTMDGGVFVGCKIEEWSKGFTLFGDFLRDAKKYYRKTCINANYIYFFSYRPMYRELSHEQLCWYLFWRSRIREGTYLKTGLSYIFLYLYEQINLSDIIGCEKVYANMIRIWKNYRTEFPRIDKYIAEWLIDFSFINKIKINLDDIEDILPEIINIVTIPEVYLHDDFFRNKNNVEMIIKNLSVYDYQKSKFYNEKNTELFDYHITRIVNSVLSGPEFEGIIKKETDEGVKIRTTRESFMGAVCVYDHKKRITIEYKNLYKNFSIRQFITDTVRYAENILRDYLNIKSKLTVAAYPEQLKKLIDEYKTRYLTAVKTPKITVKTKGRKKDGDGDEEIPEPVEFNPNIQAAAEIEKSSWDTTMTLVELQNRDNMQNAEMISSDFAEENEDKNENEDEDDDMGDMEVVEFETSDDGGEFIAIDTGGSETSETYEELDEISPVPVVVGDGVLDVPLDEDMDIFDVLENLELQDGGEPDIPNTNMIENMIETETVKLSDSQSDMEQFIKSLREDEHTALEILIKAKAENKSFDMLCAEFLSDNGGMLESVTDLINEKAMDFTGDIIFDTSSGEIIEDYRDEIEKCLRK